MDPRDILKIKSENERIKFVLDFARLAPSSHNTQPWLFSIKGRSVEIWGNKKRVLPASDSNHRQFFISLGCTLENIIVAADYCGFEYDFKIFPDDKENFLVAKIEFKNLAPQVRPEKESSIHAIQARHANRSPYLAKSVPPQFINEIKSLEAEGMKIAVIEDTDIKEGLAKIVCDATEAAFYDKGFTGELSRWIKPSLKKYRDGMPGYNIGIPWPMSFVVPLIIRYLNVARQQRKMVEEPLKQTPCFLVISSENDDRRSWVEAGRALESVWLKATEAGLKMSPLAAGIQIGDFQRKMREFLKSDLYPQVFSRLGYQDKATAPSPRLNMEEILVE